MHTDIFANAQLTPEQRQALIGLENELSKARAHIGQLEGKIAALEEQAAQDHNVLTRPDFNREVARILALDERYGGISSVLYFDFASLDGLAHRFDPAISAEVSRTIAQVLTSNVRRSDIVGRLGGDEFGVLLVRCNNEYAWKKGRELAAALANALDVIDGKKLGLDINFGAYTFHEEEDVATGLKEAAQALTKAENPKQ